MSWWADFDPGEVREEFSIIRDLGRTHSRIFLLWESFQPAPDRVSVGAFRDLRTVCDVAAETDLQVQVTFFTGHMSGPNWAPAWLLDRGRPARPGDRQLVSLTVPGREPHPIHDMYTTPFVVQAEDLLLRAVCSELRDHPAVWAWSLGNEPDLFCQPADAETRRTSRSCMAIPSTAPWREPRSIPTSSRSPRHSPPRSLDGRSSTRSSASTPSGPTGRAIGGTSSSGAAELVAPSSHPRRTPRHTWRRCSRACCWSAASARSCGASRTTSLDSGPGLRATTRSTSVSLVSCARTAARSRPRTCFAPSPGPPRWSSRPSGRSSSSAQSSSAQSSSPRPMRITETRSARWPSSTRGSASWHERKDRHAHSGRERRALAAARLPPTAPGVVPAHGWPDRPSAGGLALAPLAHDRSAFGQPADGRPDLRTRRGGLRTRGIERRAGPVPRLVPQRGGQSSRGGAGRPPPGGRARSRGRARRCRLSASRAARERWQPPSLRGLPAAHAPADPARGRDTGRAARLARRR